MAKEAYWTKSGAKWWLDYNCNAGNIRVFCADGEYLPPMPAPEIKPVASIKNDVASIVQNIFKTDKTW